MENSVVFRGDSERLRRRVAHLEKVEGQTTLYTEWVDLFGGTTTHEASLMGVRSVGVDITPVGVAVAILKNALLFAEPSELKLSRADLLEAWHAIETKRWYHPNPSIPSLLMLLYFDTMDAFQRTSRYVRKGAVSLLVEKFAYVRECFARTRALAECEQLRFAPAEIVQDDALRLNERPDFEARFDACITSPLYYFSVGKDQVAYEY